MRKLLVVLALSVLIAPTGGRSIAGEDCNGNGIPDATDISQGTSQDCNGNGIPDECDTEVQFVAQPIFTAADFAQSVFAADLDGDGDIDVLSASADDDTVAWYRNTDGAGTFGLQQRISDTTDFAVAVFAADLDGDDDLDVLTAAAVGDTIAWHENTDGDGDFGPEQIIATQVDAAWSVFAADLDGDGDLDVLSASQNDNRIAWYENTDGSGGFGPQQLISTSQDIPVSVFASDVDGDGDLDVLCASASDDTIAWYENTDGEALFGSEQKISGIAAGASSVFAADLDGDGGDEILSASTDDDKIAWYKKVAGVDEFGPEQIISSTANFALSVFAADVDSDGDADVLSASAIDDKIAWYENTDGAGSFGPEQVITMTADAAVSVSAADVDGDGDTDALSASQADDTIAWYQNQSDDCNANTVPDECEPDCNANGVADGCDIASGASEDCNGNDVPDECDIPGTSEDCAGEGVPDECEPDCNGNSEADSCDIFLGTSDDCTGNGIPDECEPDCNGNSEADSCDIFLGTSEDCTGNGIPDECEPDCNGNSEADSCDLDAATSPDCDGNEIPDECDVSGGADDCNGNGVLDDCETELVYTERVISTTADLARSVVAADLDGDGDADVASGSALDDEIAWYENTDGAGSFGPPQTISTADSLQSIFAADVDGDRDIDILSAAFGDDEIAWYENTNGGGAFGAKRIISTEVSGAFSVFAADLDGDGDADVVSASISDDAIAWHENLDGAGTFGPLQTISTEADGALSVFAADLDGDLDNDVLSASFNDDTIAWYENTDGAGGFGPQQILSATAAGATSVFAADLDGDGDTDVLSASQDDDTIAWYENTNGAGAFGPPQVVSTDPNGAISVFAFDMDGDGDTDVLSASLYDNKVAWYENTDGAGTFSPPRIVTTSADGSYSAIAADLDGDGDTDVLAVSQDDDRVTWYENGGDDCNGNGVPADCDISQGTSDDCTGNAIPDECEPDCNDNSVADSCDIQGGFSDDCNANLLPDECEPDCNGNGEADGCDITSGFSEDCNTNLFPDECDIADGLSGDCNANTTPDECDISEGTSDDCDSNAVPDECDPDCNGDGTPDACDPDCNSNGIADGCEPDCNENGIADACDISGGTSIDCNGNDVPDECETECVSCDADGDNCVDDLDSDPENQFVCADTDGDTCDDCRFGAFDPANDGADADADGICNSGDCDSSDDTVWLDPASITSLTLEHDAPVTMLDWQPPEDPGAASVRYDTLRSPDPSDFDQPAICLETDELNTITFDGATPDPDELFSYLVRVENDCPAGMGAMGTNSENQAREGKSCP